MKKLFVRSLVVAAVAGVATFGMVAPAHAATSNYSSQVCAPALRPAIYGASVGSLTLTIFAPNVNRSDTWNNTTRTTRVKLTNVGENFSNGGRATFTGSLTNKGQDCRLL